MAAIVALLSGCLVAGWAPLPAEAQGPGGLLGRMRIGLPPGGGPIFPSKRFHIRPQLAIVQGRAAETVIGLHSGRDRRLLFVVLSDGNARLWDLERGVQLDTASGGDILAGAVRGAGRATEIVAIRRDGASVVLRPDGTQRLLGGAIEELDPAGAPVLSGDGSVMAFRTMDGRWHARKESGARVELPDAAADAFPMFSRDGTTVVYRTGRGATMLAARLLDQGIGLVGWLDGCVRGIPITAGVSAPDGGRWVFGDARGNLCVSTLTGGAGARRLTTLPGPVRTLAMSRDGSEVVAGAADGTVEVWSVGGRNRRVALLKMEAAASYPLVLDSGRKWILTGAGNGTVDIHSFERRKKRTLLARLISTVDGWTVLDREGRFDGSRHGVNAVSWAGDTDAETFPVDAFSESYFEPGLLAKLDDPAPTFLNEDVGDLPEEGYLRPPVVDIDPIDVEVRDGEGRVSVTVRLEAGYPPELLSGTRLYQNGKLVGQATPRAGEAVVRYRVRLSPGENRFRAIGVGPGGVEGRPATAEARIDAVPSPPDMRLVSIGINDYVRPAWELFYARNDAEAIVSALRDQGGRLFEDVRAATLLDSSADRQAIEERIRGKSSSPRDVLVVYFSGHGYALQEEHGWEWYLLPFTREWKDKTASRAEHDEKVRRYGLSSRRLMELLTTTEAQRVLLVLDSCQSGAMVQAFRTLSASGNRVVDDAVAQKALRRIARVGGIHVLAASRAHETATELQLAPHGALTYLVLEGIQGSADGDGDREIRVSEIVDYATAEMPKLARRLVQEPISQKPVGYSRGEDFPLAKL